MWCKTAPPTVFSQGARAHHLHMDFGAYFTSIDWLSAVVVAAIVVLVAMVLLRFMLATSSEVGHMVPGAGEAAGRAVLDMRDMPIDSWVCTTCRSVNTPHSTHCYRGCGEREVVAEPLPTDRSLIADARNGGRVR
jgi:hypothetical protein